MRGHDGIPGDALFLMAVTALAIIVWAFSGVAR